MGSCPDRCELEPLLQSLERLTETHQRIAALRGSSLLEEEEQDHRQEGQYWQLFGISQAARILLNSVLVHQQTVASESYPPEKPHCTPLILQDSNTPILVSPAIDSYANHQYPLLFSDIRKRYQSIVEELMETEEPNNRTLSAFIQRQASGAFLCRYGGCPRAAQGFQSSELRENHEESHRPRFQCALATCGLFGTTFNSRAAMKKHAARYHDEDNTASVPDSLSRKPRDPHVDRTLFAFSDVKTKRKAEGSRAREEYSESLQADQMPELSLDKNTTRMMDRHEFSRGLLKLAVQNARVPDHVKQWGQLKQWAAQNSNILPQGSIQKITELQSLLYQQLLTHINQQKELINPESSQSNRKPV